MERYTDNLYETVNEGQYSKLLQLNLDIVFWLNFYVGCWIDWDTPHKTYISDIK